MKIKLVREQFAGGRTEWLLEIDRTTSAEHARWATEDREKYRAALLAIEAAPAEAEAIVKAVL